MGIPTLGSSSNCHWLINVSVVRMLWRFVLRAGLPGITTISRVRLRIVILFTILLFPLFLALSVAIITDSSFSRAGHLSRVFVLEV